MNSILESADPGRVNGFLAAFPDRGFGTAEFFSVPWSRLGFWENSHVSRIQPGGQQEDTRSHWNTGTLGEQ